MGKITNFFHNLAEKARTVTTKTWLSNLLVFMICLVALLPICVVTAASLVWALIKLIGRIVKKVVSWLNSLFSKHPWLRWPYTVIVVALIGAILVSTGIVKTNFPSFTNKTPANSQVVAEYKKETISLNDGKDKLSGIDISSYQSDKYENLIAADDVDFVICRATVKNKVDMYCDRIFQEAKRQHKLLGIYFYTNPKFTSENPDARAHARWAASQVEGYIGYAIFALDSENDNSDYVDTAWNAEWLDEFQKVTGVRPLLYTGSKHMVNDWSNIAPKYPLWIAHWGAKTPNFKHWDEYTVWQYTSNGDTLDEDYFAGTAKDWWDLCAKH